MRNQQSGIAILLLLAVVSAASAVPITGCSEVYGGNYTLTGDLAGANISAPAFGSGKACIILSGNGSTLDCNGYRISNNGTGGTTWGIIVNNHDVAVRNCNVSNYTYGYYLYGAVGPNDNIGLQDDVARNNTYGIALLGSKISVSDSVSEESGIYDLYASPSSDADCQNTVSNLAGSGGRLIYYANQSVSWSGLDASEVLLCNADGSTLSGISVRGSDARYNNGVLLLRVNNSVITSSNSSYNYNGFSARESGGNSIRDSVASFNSQSGFLVSTSSNDNNISNNTACNNTLYGFYVNDNSYRNRLVDNVAYEQNLSGGAGFYSTWGYYTYYINNTAYNNSAGFGLHGFYFNVVNNTAFLNVNGMGFPSGSSHNVTGNRAFNNTRCVSGCTGYAFTGGVNAVRFYNNSAYYNYIGVKMESSTPTNNDLFNNFVYFNNNNGFEIRASSGNRFSNNTVWNNGKHGFYLYQSGSNNLTANNVSFNGGMSSGSGFYNDIGASSNLFVNNTAYDNYQYGFGVNSIGGNNYVGNNATLNNHGFYVTGGSTTNNMNFTGNNASSNSMYGFYISTGGYSGSSRFRDNYAAGNSQGFSIGSSYNNNLTNNTAFGNYVGFQLSNTYGNNLTNNSAVENQNYDLWVLASSDAYCRNAVANMSGSGGRPINYSNVSVTWVGMDSSEIVLCNADFSSISDSYVRGSDTLQNNLVLLLRTDNATLTNISSLGNKAGFYLSSANSNALQGCNGSGNAEYGFNIDGDYNLLNSSVADGNGYNGFNLLSGSSYTLVNMCSAWNNTNGYVVDAPYNNLTNDIAEASGSWGFQLSYNADNCLLESDVASGSATDGFYVAGDYNTLSSNTAHDNGRDGFLISNFPTCYGNNLTANEAYGNNESGFYLGSPTNTLLADNLAHDNPAGIILFSSAGTNLSANLIYGNSGSGIDLNASTNSTLSGDRLWGNSPDLLMENQWYSGAVNLRMDGVVFDNPSGNYSSYTNLSLNDTVAGNTGYSIAWAAAIAAPYQAFEGKFVNITPLTPPVSIDRVVWTWTDGEVSGGGYDESLFAVWKKGSGAWNATNSTLDMGANTLLLQNLSPASTYAILLEVPSGDICNATLIEPASGAGVDANGTFNVTARVWCCGPNPCLNAEVLLDPSNYTQQTCSLEWGFSCGANPDSDNTFDSCANAGAYPDEHVGESYLNATMVAPGESLLATCEFTGVYEGDYGYMWYFNGTGWRQLGYIDWNGTGYGGNHDENLSAAFIADSVPGTQWVRCGIVYSSQDYDYCIDANANYFDNDDINFTVGALPIVINSIEATSQPLGIGSNTTCLANVTGDFTIASVSFNITFPGGAVIAPGNDAQVGDMWESGPITINSSGTYTCSVLAIDNESNEASASLSFGAGPKGAVPVGSGNPFYTTGPNPVSGGCLANFSNGSYCDTTWLVNATGTPGTTWEFFGSYNGGYLETNRINITIIAPLPDLPPVVSLSSPGNGSALASPQITFGFVASDDWNSTLACSLYLDGGLNATNPGVMNGTPSSISVTSIADGSHFWRVECLDGAGNTGTSPAWEFSINTTAPPAPPSDDDGRDPPISISVMSACDANTVTVRGGKMLLEGADVAIGGEDAGTTNSSGQLAFPGCGKDVRIRASKTDYIASSITKTLISCEGCAPPPPVAPEPGNTTCVCGEHINGSCVPFQCCSDSSCGDDERCDVPAGKSGGQCVPVGGDCGEARGHAFVPFGYQCGGEPGCPKCPDGQLCQDHACIASGLRGPDSGYIGNRSTVEAFEGDSPCAFCDISVTDPTGKILTGRTDGYGRFDIPLAVEGAYTVSLLQNGAVVKTITILALPLSAPIEPGKPSAVVQEDWSWLLWLIILLVLFFAALVYWRRGKKKEKTGKEALPKK